MNFLNTLLEKTSDWDKDERYMATNDLMNELLKDKDQHGPKMDELMEKRICAAVLKQLDDHSNEVQSVAVKCLSILLKKVKQAQIDEICSKLSTLIIDGKSELRDIYSIGLKTLINDVPDEMGSLVCKRLLEKLVYGINTTPNNDVKSDCIDILSDLIRRFGHLVDLTEVTNVILSQLENHKSLIKKRSASCLGSIAVVCSDVLLSQIVESVIKKVESSKNKSTFLNDTKCYIQTLAVISKTVGYRLSKLIVFLLPIFMSYCGDPDDDDNDQTDDNNEIRDNCLIGIESLMLRQSREMTNFGISNILELGLRYMKYDPNYSYDDYDEEIMDEDEGDDVFESEEQVDDSSWKVRKNAVKLIHAIIIHQSSVPMDVLINCFEELIDRFKEREENVRVEIISCCHELLHKAFPPHTNLIRNDNNINTVTKSLVNENLHLFNKVIPKLLDAILKQLNNTSVKTKSALLALLRIIATSFNEQFQNYSINLINSVKKCLDDKNQLLRLECLMFLKTMLDTTPSTLMLTHLPGLLPLIISSVNAEWFKLILEGLRVLNSLVLNMSHSTVICQTNELLIKNISNQVYLTLAPKLDANDIDGEIKESAMVVAGNLFFHFGVFLKDNIKALLGMLRKRLDSEVTRIHALRCLSVLASGKDILDELGLFFNDSAKDMAMMLRQQNRIVKLTILQAIDSFLKIESYKISIENSDSLRIEVSNLLTDADLQICQLAIQVMISLLGVITLNDQPLQQEVYSRCLELASSSIIQGQTQLSLVKLFQIMVKYPNANDNVFRKILSDLKSKALTVIDQKHAVFSNLSKCICGIVVVCQNEFNNTVSEFASELQSSNDHKKLLALYCIGEIGRTTNLTHFSNINNEVFLCFDANTEEIKTAACLCLGYLCVGNCQDYFPLILELSPDSHRQYLLLCSLKEVIHVFIAQNMGLESYLDVILQFLLNFIKSASAIDDEAFRSIVADSLGGLLYLHSEDVLPSLNHVFEDCLTNFKAKSLWTIITSFKYIFSRSRVNHGIQQSESYGLVLEKIATTIVPSILPLTTTAEDLEVRKVACLCIHALLHHHFNIILPYLQQLEPLLIESVLFKLERVVDLGPFKHKVDDGIPIRKASLLCIEEILTHIDIPKITFFLDTFVPNQLIHLIVDSNAEIKLQTHQIIIKLCNRVPNIMTPYSDLLIDPLDKGVNIKKKEGIQGQELERVNELIKSNLRVIIILNEDNDLSFNHKWQLFVDRISKQNPEMVNCIKQELV